MAVPAATPETWFRPLRPDQHYEFSSDMLRSREVFELKPKEFVRQLRGATYGETNAVSPFVRVRSNRLPRNEWSPIRLQVFERDDFTCQYCGIRGVRLECDHVIPLSKGGSNASHNLKTACYPCNRAKAGKTLEEWQR